MRVLITGAAGFIGGHLTRTMATAGHDVVAVDIAPLAADLASIPGITSLHGDICDAQLMADAMRGVEVIFHQAAIASVPASFAEPARCMSVNVEGSAVVMEQARLAGVRRVVMASTSAVYGDDPTPVKHEGLTPAPRSPYAVSKLAMEMLADVYTRQYGLETVALRYFNVYGPGQPADGGYAAVIPAFFAALRAGNPAQIFGDGSQTRSFVFISDVIAANLAAATCSLPGGQGVQTLNIASDEEVTLRVLLDVMAKALGVEAAAEYHPERPGDIHRSRADITRARNLLGFDPKVTLAAGIGEMAQ